MWSQSGLHDCRQPELSSTDDRIGRSRSDWQQVQWQKGESGSHSLGIIREYNLQKVKNNHTYRGFRRETIPKVIKWLRVRPQGEHLSVCGTLQLLADASSCQPLFFSDVPSENRDKNLFYLRIFLACQLRWPRYSSPRALGYRPEYSALHTRHHVGKECRAAGERRGNGPATGGLRST